jgi:ribonuclease D
MDCLHIDESGALSLIPYTLVSTDESFAHLRKQLRDAPRLAVDIEADSLYHYFEKVCLIQISTDRETFIVDPLAVTVIEELGPLMADSSVEKVFHAAGYDVFCLRRDYGFTFANLFDTHLAAQLLGYEFLGLSALMEQILGIHHSKRRQRDDWSRRPLVPAQLDYAAMDTHHLLRLRDVLESELRQKGRMSWAEEEFAAAAEMARPEKEFDVEGYRSIKGNRDLEPQDRIVLRALYNFRDMAARKLDVPPFKVLNNSVLIDLAKHPPGSAQDLFGRSGISGRVARKFAKGILDTITEARGQDPSVLDVPSRSNGKPPNREARNRMDMLKIWRRRKSEEFELPIGVIFPANLLESLAVKPPADMAEFAAVPGVRQWRVKEFGAEIMHLLQKDDSTS